MIICTTSIHNLTLLGKFSFLLVITSAVDSFLSTAELAATPAELATHDPPASLQGVACLPPKSCLNLRQLSSFVRQNRFKSAEMI